MKVQVELWNDTVWPNTTVYKIVVTTQVGDRKSVVEHAFPHSPIKSELERILDCARAETLEHWKEWMKKEIKR